MTRYGRATMLALMLMSFGVACGGSGGGGGLRAGGGVTGSGISAVRGNVVTVQMAASTGRATAGTAVATEARSDPGGIRVSIEGSTIAGETDGAGSFALAGEFGGSVTVRFARAEDGIDARLVLDVPRGGVIQLQDVQVEAGDDRAEPRARTIDFDGRVLVRDCAAATLVVRSTSDRGSSTFVVRIQSARLEDDDGGPLGCEDLAVDDELDIEGVLQADGSIDAQVVERERDGTGPGGEDDEDDAPDDTDDAPDEADDTPDDADDAPDDADDAPDDESEGPGGGNGDASGPGGGDDSGGEDEPSDSSGPGSGPGAGRSPTRAMRTSATTSPPTP